MLPTQDIAYYQALSAEGLQTDAARIAPSAAASQELYEPGLEPSATAKLGDLQHSWETLKNVVSLSSFADTHHSGYRLMKYMQRYTSRRQSDTLG